MSNHYDRFGLPLLDCEGKDACALRTCSNVLFVAGSCAVAVGVIIWSVGRYNMGAVGFGALCVFLGLVCIVVPFIRCSFYRKEVALQEAAVQDAIAAATSEKDERIAELSLAIHEKDAVIDDLTDDVAIAHAVCEDEHERLREALAAETHLVRIAHEAHHHHQPFQQHYGHPDHHSKAHRVEDSEESIASVNASSSMPAEAISSVDMMDGRDPPKQFTMKNWTRVRDAL
jgi:hypothetical protein